MKNQQLEMNTPSRYARKNVSKTCFVLLGENILGENYASEKT